MALNSKTSEDAGPRILLLIPPERSRNPSNEPSASTHESAELLHARAQLDDALEEVAFLREQLRAAEAWSAHRVETLRERHRTARESFVRDLAILVEGLDE